MLLRSDADFGAMKAILLLYAMSDRQIRKSMVVPVPGAEDRVGPVECQKLKIETALLRPEIRPP